mmetsp:Transcript_6112/g.17055  ORF Transcript_6112/g.17055 Transcript_6112/m.17055 type:complete len:318 (+) Transcript_6112:1042-1995(+)
MLGLPGAGQRVLLTLQGLQAGIDIWVHKVGDVVSIHDLRHDVILPLLVLQLIELAHVHAVDSAASGLLLRILLRPLPLTGLTPPASLLHPCRDARRPGSVVARRWHRHMHAVEHVGQLLPTQLPLNAAREQAVASNLFDIHHALFRQRAHGEQRLLAVVDDHLLAAVDAVCEPVGILCHVLHQLPVRGAQSLEPCCINLVGNDEDGFVGKQRLDGLEEGGLLLDSVAALLADVHNVKHSGAEVGKSRHALHLNGVALLQGAVQDPRGVDHLPAQVLVVHVPHVEGLGGEGIRLNLHVGAGHLVHEAALANVGIPADQ